MTLVVLDPTNVVLDVLVVLGSVTPGGNVIPGGSVTPGGKVTPGGRVMPAAALLTESAVVVTVKVAPMDSTEGFGAGVEFAGLPSSSAAPRVPCVSTPRVNEAAYSTASVLGVLAAWPMTRPSAASP